MSHTLFISDLHLCQSRPNINELFFDFLKNTAPQAEALYILGDLFEYWIGDDDIDSGLNGQVVKALAALGDSRTKTYFMHGNRDFLIGERFTKLAKLTLLPDPTLIDLYGKRTLLMHGDTLCTDDIDYQHFRRKVRAGNWQKVFLAKPLEVRRAEVEAMRAGSEKAKQAKPIEIKDVAENAVLDLLRRYDRPALIHGHTHRRACHNLEINGYHTQRWVLPDWYETGGYLKATREGDWQFFELSALLGKAHRARNGGS
jgi:UDP-2,3-diacylglucosamine hydrolase